MTGTHLHCETLRNITHLITVKENLYIYDIDYSSVISFFTTFLFNNNLKIALDQLFLYNKNISF